VSRPVVTPHFGGATVLLLESRLASETAAMVRRLGGEPVSAPALAEADVDADAAVGAIVELLQTAQRPLVVFLTGVAVTRLFTMAERLQCASALSAGLSRADVLARGPKPAGALTRRGLSAPRTVAEPFTTAEVIAALDECDVEDRDVAVVHYGEPSEPIVRHLEQRGARVTELLLYEWRLPDDVALLDRAVADILGGQIAVVAFTSQIQVRHLLEVAGPRREPVITALNAGAVVGAVGPTCKAACLAAGLTRIVTPAHPKLAPLLHALATACASPPAAQRGIIE
jgi:uroporphyrinogen-III synthase